MLYKPRGGHRGFKPVPSIPMRYDDDDKRQRQPNPRQKLGNT